MSQVVDRDQQRERRIEAAGDADIQRRAGRKLLDPLGQPRALDAEDLGAAAVQLGPLRRHERRARHVALQAVHRLAPARTERGGTASRTTRPSSKLVVTRRSVCSLATSTSWVIAYESRRTGWPSPTRGDSASKTAVLGDQAMAAEDDVGRRFGRPAAGHRVGRRSHRPDWPTTRSVRYRLLPIVSLLAERLSKTVAPAMAWKRAGRHRHPQVLADLDAHDHAAMSRRRRSAPCASNSRSIPNGTRRPSSSISAGSLADGRAEPSALVEFLVVGEELLGHDAQDRAVADHDGAVEQAVADRNRRPDDDELRAARGRLRRSARWPACRRPAASTGRTGRRRCSR